MSLHPLLAALTLSVPLLGACSDHCYKAALDECRVRHGSIMVCRSPEPSPTPTPPPGVIESEADEAQRKALVRAQQERERAAYEKYKECLGRRDSNNIRIQTCMAEKRAICVKR